MYKHAEPWKLNLHAIKIEMLSVLTQQHLIISKAHRTHIKHQTPS